MRTYKSQKTLHVIGWILALGPATVILLYLILTLPSPWWYICLSAICFWVGVMMVACTCDYEKLEEKEKGENEQETDRNGDSEHYDLRAEDFLNNYRKTNKSKKS